MHLKKEAVLSLLQPKWLGLLTRGFRQGCGAAVRVKA